MSDRVKFISGTYSSERVKKLYFQMMFSFLMSFLDLSVVVMGLKCRSLVTGHKK